MQRTTWLVIVVVASVLGGCLDAAETSGSPDEAERGSKGTSLPDPVRMDFELALGGIVPFRISALVWSVENATTAVVLVHGQSGVKENYWHPAPDRASSFGARVADTGRTVLAIDLPGYGESDGDPNAVPFDMMAAAVRGVADAARAGQGDLETHEKVVAFGLSMGATIVNMAASGDDALDAIVPTGSPISPRTEEGKACRQSGCPEADALYNGEFYIPNIDWEVANATIAGYEDGQHDANDASNVAWHGDCHPRFEGVLECLHGGRNQATAAEVRVPVFTWVGQYDISWLGTDLTDEPSFYPTSPRVDTWIVPDTSHFIHNHRTQPEIVARLDAWLVDLHM